MEPQWLLLVILAFAFGAQGIGLMFRSRTESRWTVAVPLLVTAVGVAVFLSGAALTDDGGGYRDSIFTELAGVTVTVAGASWLTRKLDYKAAASHWVRLEPLLVRSSQHHVQRFEIYLSQALRRALLMEPPENGGFVHATT